MTVSTQIDAELCTGCGLCIAVCPNQTITLVDGKARISGNKCMACCHCQAVCPAEAIEVGLVSAELGFHHIAEKKGWLAPGSSDAAELVQLLRSRRSVRSYQEKSVPRLLLEDLVKIGTTAPSGTNSQAWTFTLLKNREEVELLGELTAAFFRRLNKKAANPLWRLAAKLFAGDSLGRYYRRHYQTVRDGLADWEERGKDHLFHGAPAAILVGGQSEASCPAEDALLASGHILLGAHALGLSTCLIGFVVEAMRHDRDIGKTLNLAPDEEIYAVIAVGYGREAYLRPAGRKKVKIHYLNSTGGNRRES
ncbi:MAG: nitroreductase family protein [Thermodesulfobacteriota bacterium]